MNSAAEAPSASSRRNCIRQAAHANVDALASKQYARADLLPARWTAHFDAVPGRVFLVLRTTVLIGGQNLFHLARSAWAPVTADPSSPLLMAQLRRLGPRQGQLGPPREDGWT